MKFCFVQLSHISEKGGGAEVQARYLAEELANRGYEVHYICMTLIKENINNTTIINNVNVHWLPLLHTLSKSNFKKIESLLLSIKPDFVIERMTSSLVVPILRARQIARFKYIWICTDDTSPEKLRTVNNYFGKLPMLKFVYSIPNAFKIDFIRFKANKKADIVFSQNDTQEQLILDNFKRKSYRMISGHPKPIKLESFENKFQNKTIIWCANLGRHKRPELFVELAKTYVGSDYNFVMIGGYADKAYVDTIFKNKPPNLKVTGQLSFDKALCYFDKASLLVNTSVSEGFSNTYIQAWLRGVPTLVFGADPNKVIEKNKLGFNVSNVAQAKKDIDSIFVNQDKYKLLCENVISYSNKNHTIEIMTDNFLSKLNVL